MHKVTCRVVAGGYYSVDAEFDGAVFLEGMTVGQIREILEYPDGCDASDGIADAAAIALTPGVPDVMDYVRTLDAFVAKKSWVTDGAGTFSVHVDKDELRDWCRVYCPEALS